MRVDLGTEQEVQANVEALVKLHVNSVPTKVHPNDPNVLEWTPTKEIDWDGSKKNTIYYAQVCAIECLSD